MEKTPWYKRILGPPKAKAASPKPKKSYKDQSLAEKINWGGQYRPAKSSWTKPKKKY